MDNKLKAAVTGGVAVGLLSAIPFVNIVNTCCCAWAIVGGALSVYLYMQNSDIPRPVKPGDGAILGLMAGGIGAIIYLIVGLPLGIITGNAMMSGISGLAKNFTQDPQVLAQLEMASIQMQNMSLGQKIANQLPGLLLGMVGIAAMATVGGLIGVALLEKNKGNNLPPPPPAGFGPGAGGGYDPNAGNFGGQGGFGR